MSKKWISVRILLTLKFINVCDSELRENMGVHWPLKMSREDPKMNTFSGTGIKLGNEASESVHVPPPTSIDQPEEVLEKVDDDKTAAYMIKFV